MYDFRHPQSFSPLPPRPLHNYQRTPVRDLRALPIRENPRLQLLDYRLTDAPGLVNPRIGVPRTHGHGAVLLTSGYVIQVSLTRDTDGWFLETETRCYDEQTAARTDTALSGPLLADLYRAIQRQQTAAEGRAYGCSVGRN